MSRLLLIACALAALPACRPAPPAKPAKVALTIELPKFDEYRHVDPPRLNRLKIDGVEQALSPTQSGKRIEVTAEVPAGKREVEVELSFWPAAYSNTVRTKTARVGEGGRASLDMRQAEEGRPDRFIAIYLPAPQELTDAQMRLAGVGKGDVVFDIGCGDGRLIITAVKKFGAKRGVGIDIRKEMVDLSNENARKAGVADRCEFRHEDALKLTDLSPYSVVFLYLGEELSEQLLPVFVRTLRPGTRVVSNTFPIGDWEPDDVELFTCENEHGEPETYQLFLWVVR